LVACYQFCITIGILLANCVVYATENRDDSGSYRIPIAIQFLWAIILGTGLFFLPESPRFYVKKGKMVDAAKSLARVRGQPIDSAFIQEELAEIVANYEYEQAVIPQTSYIGGWTNCFKGSIFKGNSNSRRTTVGILLQMMQQLTVSEPRSVLNVDEPGANDVRFPGNQFHSLFRSRVLQVARHHLQPFPDPVDHNFG
jgi:hypothetical protein